MATEFSIPDVPPSKGFKLRHTLKGHFGITISVAWSPDGQLLASGSADMAIRLWNAQTGLLLNSLLGHSGFVLSVAWSPDGQTLASGSADRTIRLWNAQTGQLLRTLTEHSSDVNSVIWSPNGQVFASISSDKTIRLWDAQTGQLLRTLKGHTRTIWSVAWSPDGQFLASGSDDATIRLWNTQTGQLLRILKGHSSFVSWVTWSPDGQIIASASGDRTIRLWNAQTGQHLRTLEGHTDVIHSLSFSFDGRLLASKSADGTICFWRSDGWKIMTVLNESVSSRWITELAFHPIAPVLASLGNNESDIRIWDLDFDLILGTHSSISSVSYTNAKVVLLGDSGVGKSGLGLVLSGQKFEPTMSTHGRRVWPLDRQEFGARDGRKEIRETLLWDLAGQPGYRLIHQLYLDDVAVALVVFDSRSETDPFAGVQFWERALGQARRIEGNLSLSLKKFLVAARTDRGSIGVSQERILSLVQELGFDGYFETSASEGWRISELKIAIQKGIDWETLPKVSSTELFQQINTFLVKQKESGQLLSTIGDLYRAFLTSQNAPIETEVLQAQFETCIGRVESAGLIKRLHFGKLVLLQPELLDAYASALVNAVKNEPDGLGSITERRVRAGDFRMPEDERIKDKEQEKLLLIMMVEDLLSHELALREEPFLIFPSQSTRENLDLPGPEGRSVVFTFEGPVLNIYTTLAVRLSYSDLFEKKELWKNSITYTARVGGICGMYLRNTGEGRGELSLFFDKAASEETKFNFESYIQLHLQRRALPESLKRRRIFLCNGCGWVVTDQTIQMLIERNSKALNCPICGTHISILDHEERLAVISSASVLEMDRVVDAQRDREVAKSTVQGKKEIRDFDVFLCHHNVDKPTVKTIGQQLAESGILPWLDEWELQPGLPWPRLLEQQIGQIRSAAVFVGKDGIGPWQQIELEAFLREFVNRGCPVIPVLLPESPVEPQLPIFLRGMTWVDFRKQEPDPMDQLIWGITGNRHWKIAAV